MAKMASAAVWSPRLYRSRPKRTPAAQYPPSAARCLWVEGVVCGWSVDQVDEWHDTDRESSSK
jgi:hypothetical protein